MSLYWLNSTVGEYDVIIIGGGPIGLIAAKEALRQNKKVLIIHKPESEEHLYSPNLSLLPVNKLNLLRGLGGTANAWHGQGMRFPQQYFLDYFKESKYWTYQRYLQLSQEIEKIFGMKIEENNGTRYFRAIKKRIPKNARISLKVSHVPRKIKTWSTLFASEIGNKNLDILEESVASLSIHENWISCINTLSGQNIYVTENSLIILAGNPLGNIEILMNTEITNSMFFPGIGHDIFDHPHAVTQWFEPNGDFNFLGNTFKYPIRKFYRIKIKKKFVVTKGNQDVGIFELNPVYSNLVKENILIKISQKFMLKLFRKHIRKPDRIEVWVQIEKTERGNNNKDSRAFFIENGKLHWIYEISAGDFSRFYEITEAANSMLEKNGFKRDLRFQNNKEFHPTSAFHPSGTIKIGYNLQEYSFNYEGFSNKYRNLMVGGSAMIGAGSWINPTLPIMTIMLGNIREALSSAF